MKSALSLASIPFLFLLLLLAPQMLTETTVVTSYVANLAFRNNFHEVNPGKFYRSAAMNPKDLEQVVRDQKIKTVIDLRMSGPKEYSDGSSDISIAERNHAKYFHVPLSSARADQKAQLLYLLELYRNAETPILVQCSSGTHRSGLASALWLIEKEKKSLEEAALQLTRKYGFFTSERALKAISQSAPTLDSNFWLYKEAFQNSGASLQSWLEEELKADFAASQYRPVSARHSIPYRLSHIAPAVAQSLVLVR